MIRAFAGKSEIQLKTFVFSGGEVQVRIENEMDFLRFDLDLNIRADIHNSQDVMTLFMVTDALRRCFPGNDIDLICPYLPYARQDRVCYPGESHALKVFCEMVNTQNYRSVEVWDVHSDVSLALLDRVKNIPASSFLKSYNDLDMVAVSPDAGAIKRTSDAAKILGIPMVVAEKVRDPNTGQITSTQVHCYQSIEKKSFLIVDDICDGGRTFIELAKVLRPLTNDKIVLYVTHGIFSQGVGVFDGLIDVILTANIFPTKNENHNYEINYMIRNKTLLVLTK